MLMGRMRPLRNNFFFTTRAHQKLYTILTPNAGETSLHRSPCNDDQEEKRNARREERAMWLPKLLARVT